MASYTQAHQASEEDIKIFFDYFTNIEQALEILNHALLNNELAKEEGKKLLSYPPLTRVLIDRGVTDLDCQSAHFAQPLQTLDFTLPFLPDNHSEANPRNSIP